MPKNNYKAGTLIFQSLNNEADFNYAVSRSGSSPNATTIINNINHVGLYIGDNQIIEATQQYGVILRPLPDFLREADNNLSAIVKDSQLINAAIDRAKSCLGCPYNASFHPDADGFYCSELITYAFKTAQGQDYFQQYPMNFTDYTTGQILPYWRNYYRELKQDIPQGLLGSHPQQLLKQRHLLTEITQIFA